MGGFFYGKDLEKSLREEFSKARHFVIERLRVL